MFKKKRRGCGCLAVIAIFALLFIVGISQQHTSSAEPPTVTPTPLPTSDASIEQFKQDALPLLADYSAAFQAFGELTTAVGNDPALMLTNTWKMQTAAAVTQIRSLNTKVYILKPPPSFEPSWAEMRNAADKYDQAMNLFVKGVDGVDVNQLTAASSLIIEGKAAIKRAQLLLP